MDNKYLQKKISISDAIDYAKIFNEDKSNKFARFPYLYAAEADDPLRLTTVCYLDSAPKVVDGIENYPDFVKKNNLDVLCPGDVFIDTYDALESQKQDFTKDDFIKGLNYYIENDDFMDF